MSEMSSCDVSRVTRSRAVKGGKTTCSRCDARRAQFHMNCIFARLETGSRYPTSSS